MKKFITITKSIALVLSMFVLIGFIGSCDKNQVTKFTWDKSAAPTLVSLSSTAAKLGEELTITGKYFSATADNVVSFSGVEATIISANITSITVIIPDAPDGELTVISDGKTSVNSLPYTIIQPIVPTITSIDPVKGKIGQEVTITGTDFSTTPSENIVKFNGIRANVLSSTATTITAIVPAGATTGNVTVTRDGESNGILFTVTVSYTVVIPLSDDNDDGEEGDANGAMALTSSDLELGEFDTWAAKDDIPQGVQDIGVRFNAIDVPAGATILSASIQFTCDATGDDPAEVTIYCENIGNAPPLEEIDYNISSRAVTAESIVWDIPAWLNEGDHGLAQRTPDLTSIVQAIVNRGDWIAGNSMLFIIKPSGTTVDETSSSGGREAEADVGDDAAILTIVYE